MQTTCTLFEYWKLYVNEENIHHACNLIWFYFTSAASAHTVETTIDEYPGVSGITTARDAMRNLSEEDKDKIAAQVKHLIIGLWLLYI